MTPEWISANYASKFAAHMSYEGIGRLAICERAHSGLIRAKAKLLTVEKLGETREKANALIPNNFWWAEGHDALEANWQTGDFSTWIEGNEHWKAFGVSFDFLSLIDLVPATDRAAAMRDLSIVNNPDWTIAPLAHKQAMSSGLHDTHTANWAIIERCRTGHIIARAQMMERYDNSSREAPTNVELEWDVPLWFWRNFIEATRGTKNWDVGTFAGNGHCDDGKCYIRLSGVHFLQASLAMSTGAPTESKPTDKAKGGPGRRNKYDWEGALLHLIGLAELESIAPDPDAHGTQADIAKLIADWFAAQGGDVPENSQLRNYAKRALDAIRQQSANK